MDNNNSFLGRGWSFPPAFSLSAKSVIMEEGEDDIQSSLKILLSTRLGERIMQPNFGCALNELVFEPLTTTLKTYTKDLIETAILYHEPRIEVDNIDLTENTSQGLIMISLDYRIRATNSRRNLVFPFYKTEGGSTVKGVV